jgi:hypothetical protein
MFDTRCILLKKIKISFLNNWERGDPPALESMNDKHRQISMIDASGQSAISPYWKPATLKCLGELEDLGIKLDRSLSMAEAQHILSLFHPPTDHQVEILKYFKVKNRSEITRIQAHYLIQTLFSDPTNIEHWKQRPPTSTLKQGILFMGGRLNSGMTHIEAHSKLMHYGKENPDRFDEWRHIERLFLSVNDTDTLELHDARKITWKRFFQIYDAIKSSGVQSDSINTDKIHQHIKQISLAEKKTLSGELFVRQLKMSYSGFQAPQ